MAVVSSVIFHRFFFFSVVVVVYLENTAGRMKRIISLLRGVEQDMHDVCLFVVLCFRNLITIIL